MKTSENCLKIGHKLLGDKHLVRPRGRRTQSVDIQGRILHSTESLERCEGRPGNAAKEGPDPRVMRIRPLCVCVIRFRLQRVCPGLAGADADDLLDG